MSVSAAGFRSKKSRSGSAWSRRGGMLEAACVHPDQDRDGRSAREGSRWEKCSPILRKGIYKGSTQLVDPLDHGRAR